MQKSHLRRLFFLLITLSTSAACVSSTGGPTGSAGATPTESAGAFPISNEAIRAIMKSAIDTFDTPSVSVGIFYQGEIVFSGAHGLRNVESNLIANDQTYYRLASLSKAFTTAGLAVLIDQGKLNWQDKVIDHLPTFRLSDPWVTREFTVLDLLTHRSGLSSGAGDSMIWPEPSGFSRQEVINNLQHLTPSYSFRNGYSYSNTLYIVAGEVISAISGMPFDEFIEEQVFKPLKMNCYVNKLDAQAMTNAAMSYGHDEEKGFYPISRNQIRKEGLMSAAAGGMVCNTQEMLKWIGALLNPDMLPFDEQLLEQMWSAYTPLSISQTDQEWNNTEFRAYGLGWRLSNFNEYKVVSHTGTLSGYQAYLALVPKLQLGVIVLNNGSNYGVRGSIMQSILSAVIAKHTSKTKTRDWIQAYVDFQAQRAQEAAKRNTGEPIGKGSSVLTTSDVIGQYQDKWFDTFEIKSENDNQTLRIRHNKMSTLIGTLTPFSDYTFVVEWDNQNAQRDAFLHFDVNIKGDITGMSMHPFTHEMRENHEYKDMYFNKVSR